MSSKLFPYKLTKGQWFRAESFTESDIAVIVDTTREMIWFWEGNKSSARSRSNARDMLGQLKALRISRSLLKKRMGGWFWY